MNIFHPVALLFFSDELYGASTVVYLSNIVNQSLKFIGVSHDMLIPLKIKLLKLDAD